jgi:hypothetical protein
VARLAISPSDGGLSCAACIDDLAIAAAIPANSSSDSALVNTCSTSSSSSELESAAAGAAVEGADSEKTTLLSVVGSGVVFGAVVEMVAAAPDLYRMSRNTSAFSLLPALLVSNT